MTEEDAGGMEEGCRLDTSLQNCNIATLIPRVMVLDLIGGLNKINSSLQGFHERDPIEFLASFAI